MTPKRRVLWAIGALALYVAIGRLSLLLATVHVSSSPVWPPAGFAIGLLALSGLRFWPIIWTGAYVVNAWSSGDFLVSGGIATGNALEAVAAAWIIRRFIPQGHLESMRSLGTFAGAASVGALTSASIGVLSLVAGGTPPELSSSIWLTWAVGNLAGTLIVAPLILSARNPTPRDGLVLAVGAFTGLVAFATSGWTLVLLLPAMAWMSIHLDRFAEALGLLGLAAGAITLTVLGQGAFGNQNPNQALLLLQFFLVGLAALSMVLSTGVKRRDAVSVPRAWRDTMFAIVPLVLATMFVGLSWHPTLESLEFERQETASNLVIDEWQISIQENDQRLNALRALYESSDEVTRADFNHFVELQGWTFGPGGTTAVGFARILEPSEISNYEARVRQDTTLPDPVRLNFAVFPAVNGTAIVVDHVFPMEPEPGAIGFNLGLDPNRVEALQRGAMTNQSIATEPVDIVKPSGIVPGFFINLPVWIDGELFGYVLLAQTVEDAGLNIPAGSVEYRITDVTAGGVLLYETAEFGAPTKSSELVAWGRTWKMEMLIPSLLAPEELQASWFILSAGALMSVAIGAVVYAHNSTRYRAEELSKDLVRQARLDAERLTEIQKLEDRDQFRRSFLNMVAHELRTPLTPIRTQAYILKQAAGENEAKAHEIMERGVKRLSSVVDDLLVAAKLETDGLELVMEPMDLLHAAQAALESFEDSAAQDGTTIALQGESTIVQADRSRVDQVLDNLLSNALKFAKGGNVHMSIQSDATSALLRVTDDGLGIEADKLEDVGRPFSRVHDQSKLTVRGTGLGVHICTSIMQLHGGSLEVQSDGLGKGTTFTIRFPLDSTP